ncbi:hypothetical protein D3C75_234930 [compost metagenome]
MRSGPNSRRWPCAMPIPATGFGWAITPPWLTPVRPRRCINCWAASFCMPSSMPAAVLTSRRSPPQAVRCGPVACWCCWFLTLPAGLTSPTAIHCAGATVHNPSSPHILFITSAATSPAIHRYCCASRGNHLLYCPPQQRPTGTPPAASRRVSRPRSSTT